MNTISRLTRAADKGYPIWFDFDEVIELWWDIKNLQSALADANRKLNAKDEKPESTIKAIFKELE